MKEIINNEYASVSYDSLSNSIIAVWKQPCTAELFRTISKIILDKIREYKVDAYVSDIFHQGIVTREDRNWMQEEVMPEVYRLGVKKVCIVAPSDVFSMFYIESIRNSTATETLDVEFKYFNDLISAQAWLLDEAVPA